MVPSLSELSQVQYEALRNILGLTPEEIIMVCESLDKSKVDEFKEAVIADVVPEKITTIVADSRDEAIFKLKNELINTGAMNAEFMVDLLEELYGPKE